VLDDAPPPSPNPRPASLPLEELLLQALSKRTAPASGTRKTVAPTKAVRVRILGVLEQASVGWNGGWRFGQYLHHLTKLEDSGPQVASSRAPTLCQLCRRGRGLRLGDVVDVSHAA
jgi:hypothetical protein